MAVAPQAAEPVAAAESASDHDTQPALITNEPVAKAAENGPAVNPASATASASISSPNANRSTHKSGGVLAMALEGQTAPVKPAASAGDGAAAPTEHKSVQKKKPAKESKSAAKSNQQDIQARDAKGDRDVAVLQALIAVSQEREPPRVKPTTAKAPSPSRDSNRDIVERKPNDSTESLLGRCSQLGWLEGELCRWRICSGRWTSDAACAKT